MPNNATKKILLTTSAWTYRHALRPLFFLFPSEDIHQCLTAGGEWFGRRKIIRGTLAKVWTYDHPSIAQDVADIHFARPVGLAAGFDYQAQLPGILPSLGFGFGTIGTITSHPYAGNPKPRLGRLIRSRSLLVNKGFRNDGIHAVLQKLKNNAFDIPIGISIGQTNKPDTTSHEDAIRDIVSSFQAVEASGIPFAYYELNISCPNLNTGVTFAKPESLFALVQTVTSLNLSRPLFIKMPIDKSNDEIKRLLETLTQFRVTGLIFGNLQKDRNDPSLIQEEVVKCGRGNFSGKPTWQRSNELIAFTYREYGQRFVIIGCGGIFSAEDAYKKIRLGASLVQLITGMIFEGPQLIGQISLGLSGLLRRDGFNHVRDAVGVDSGL